MLKKVSFCGFKSFCDPTEIDLTTGITAIVGPNGCGKSNFFDGIRWVLGETSAKSLRGGKMEDVIFSGSQTKPPADSASVTLVLDNRDRLFLDRGEEVAITRRATRNAGSEFFINNESVRLKDIHALLMDSGIGANSYSLIGQGQIESILSTKKEDRRAIFEEASGIVKLKGQKEATDKRLEAVEEDLIRMHDILKEVKKRLSPLEKQAARATTYQSLSSRLQDIEVQYLLHGYDREKERKKEKQREKEALEESLLHANEAVEDAKKARDDVYQRQKKEQHALFQYQEDVAQKKEALQKENGAIGLYEEKIRHATSSLQEAVGQLEELEKTYSFSAEDVEGKRHRAEFLAREITEGTDHAQALQEEISALEKTLFTLQEEIEEIRNTSISAYNENQQLRYELQTTEKQKQAIQTSLDHTEEAKRDLQEKIQAATTDLQTKNELHATTLSTLSSLEQTKRDIESRTHSVTDSHSRLSREIQEKERTQYRLQDKLDTFHGLIDGNQWFFEGVKSVLSLLNKPTPPPFASGIIGTVADKLVVQKAYEVAIEALLTSTMQWMIVDHDKTAQGCITYLKQHQKGRATFLPLNMARPSGFSPAEERILRESPGITPALETVSFPGELSPVFSSLLGRMVVARSMEDGVAFLQQSKMKVKVATLDGEVLQNGSMSGGGSKKQRANYFSMKREKEEMTSTLATLKKELDDRKRAQEAHQAEKMALEKEQVALAQGIEEAKKESDTLLEEVKEARHLLATLATQAEDIDFQEKTLLQEKKDVSKKWRDARVLLDEKEMVYQQLQDTLLSKQADKGNGETKLNGKKKTHQDLLLSLASMKEEEKAIASYLQTLSQSHDSLEHNMEHWLEKKAEEQKHLEDYHQTLQERTQEREGLAALLQEAQQHVSTTIQQLKATEEDITQQEQSLSLLLSKKQAVESSLHQVEITLSEIAATISSIVTRLYEAYEIEEKDISCLERAGATMSAALQTEIGEIKKKIASLGNIHQGAPEEYEALKKRYDTEQQAIEDIEVAKRDILTLRESIVAEMTERFCTTFEHIATHFTETFTNLFEGGTGKLLLEDPEHPLTSGIEIIAKPPGKKAQNMHMLSGGEKAFTAVALIFAIISAKPSPFVVLDEVDAPLDDANVARFARYLQTFSEKSQFIVITHRQGTMTMATEVGSVYGVTQKELGSSMFLPNAMPQARKKESKIEKNA